MIEIFEKFFYLEFFENKTKSGETTRAGETFAGL